MVLICGVWPSAIIDGGYKPGRRCSDGRPLRYRGLCDLGDICDLRESHQVRNLLSRFEPRHILAARWCLVLARCDARHFGEYLLRIKAQIIDSYGTPSPPLMQI